MRAAETLEESVLQTMAKLCAGGNAMRGPSCARTRNAPSVDVLVCLLSIPRLEELYMAVRDCARNQGSILLVLCVGLIACRVTAPCDPSPGVGALLFHAIRSSGGAVVESAEFKIERGRLIYMVNLPRCADLTSQEEAGLESRPRQRTPHRRCRLHPRSFGFASLRLRM
jgi:hypothetical protein